MQRTGKVEADKIKQKILDVCTEYKTVSQISNELGLGKSYIHGFLTTMEKYIECEKRYYSPKRDVAYYKTKVKEFGSLDVPDERKWNFIPIGLKVIDHVTNGRIFKAESNDDYAKNIKESDKKRRESNKSGKVFVKPQIL